jgi:hypothetical protein
MTQGTRAGTCKYAQLLVRCSKLAPVPTVVAHALAGAVEAARLRLIVRILVGPSEKINSTAKAPGIRKIEISTGFGWQNGRSAFPHRRDALCPPEAICQRT